ncbi:O-antigen ligase [Sanguibacter gelidistatuariae]|uniref:O-antigen ligase n=1 Tax=Sanguibacter gelidistatuariae TaxID=1814289 RepID=A0A1G6QB29_9MICO|nr:O-antigen ligase family protein [Sanguibacter gelidistatuariae]SDC89518.1 O-antigen ligase [Sanguibacter gelidistatuariae]
MSIAALRRNAPFVVSAVLAVAVVVSLLTISPSLALAGAAAVVVVALTLTEPATLPIVAFPAIIVIERVGGGGPDGQGGLNLSVSDLVLFAAFWVALLLRESPLSPTLRKLLLFSAFYQATTLFTVVANPYTANVVEWFHAWLLVAGALVVGWSIGRSGRSRLAFSLFLAACAVIAVSALLQAAQDHAATGMLNAVYLNWPMAMHKNLLGAVMAMAALIVYQRPAWLGWSMSWTLPAFGLFSSALIASQSRQAILGLAVGVFVVVLRREPGRRRSKVVLVVITAAIVTVWSSTSDQLAQDNDFNSANQRLTWYADSFRLWQEHQLFGAGLRWWTTGRTAYGFQPPNAELEVLTSAGAVGLVGFLVMFGGMLWVLWRMSPAFGTLAFAAVLMRFVQGQLDLFWVAAQVPMPFLVAGLCVGAMERAAATGPAPPPLSDALTLERTTPPGQVVV